MRNAIIFSISLFAMQGCASNYAKYDAYTPDKISSEVAVSTSEFHDQVSFSGPEIRVAHKTNGFFNYATEVRLTAAKDRVSGDTVYSIYTLIRYTGDWRNFESLTFLDKRQMSSSVLDRKVRGCTSAGCTIEEKLITPITLERLAGDEDVRFQINSQRGSHAEARIPRSYIIGFLSRVAGYAE